MELYSVSQAEDFTKHTLNLSRFASSLLRNQVYPSYDAAYKAARLILLDRENINTLKQLDVTINRVAEAIAKEYTAGWQAATSELEDMAVYESAWAATTVGAYVSSALNVPAEQKIRDYVNQSLLSLGEGDRKQTGLWAQFIQESIDSNIRAYDNAIRTGYVNGETVSQMAARLRTLNDGLLKQQAEALARTGVQHYAVQARQAMAMANKRVLAREVPFTVFDNRRTIICTGIQAKYGETGWTVGESPIGLPPYHVNCLSEDTLVTTCSDVMNIYKRRYKGRMVNITTRSGRSIKITPNHPVLTARGWVKACDINLLDKVVSVKDLGRFVGKDYKNSTVSEFGKLFSSVNVAIEPGFVGNRPSSTKDFHGDVTDSDVDVIDTGSFGWDSIRKMVFDKFENNGFPSGSLVNSAFFGFCGKLKLMDGFNSASSRFVSCTSNLGYLFRSASVHSGLLLLRPVSNSAVSAFNKAYDWLIGAIKPKAFSHSVCSNAGLKQFNYFGLNIIAKFNNSWIFKCCATLFNGFVNKGSRHADDLPNLDWQNALGAELDDVIDHFFSVYDGHVYNLENKDNWYLSNGIITHNCRTVILYLPKGQERLEGNRLATGGKQGKAAEEAFDKAQSRTDRKVAYKGKKDLNKFKPEEIPADTDINSWLREQPVWFVESTLGKKRAKLFLDGKMDLAKFTDAANRPLTLAELRAIDALAFQRSGL